MTFLEKLSSGNSRYEYLDEATKSSDESPLNIVVLGLDDSGKSTLIKQIGIVWQKYDTVERLMYKEDISNKVLSSFSEILKGIKESNVRLADNDRSVIYVDIFQDILSKAAGHEGLQKYASYLSLLWSDEEIRKYFDEKFVDKSVQYFFDALERISSERYVPSDEDIQHYRYDNVPDIDSRESVEKVIVNYKGLPMQFTSVNQKSFMEKEGEFMEIIKLSDLLIFCVSLDDYDSMDSDGVTNRLEEAKRFYKSILSRECMKKHYFLLLFTKKDLFEEKLKTVEVSKVFPEFKGDNNYKDAYKFIRDMFVNDKEMKKFISKILFMDGVIDTKNRDDVLAEIFFKGLKQVIMKRKLEQLNLK